MDNLSYLNGYLYRKNQSYGDQKVDSSNGSLICSSRNSSIYALTYILKWRQNKLVVFRSQDNQVLTEPLLNRRKWLIERLKNSSIKLVKLDFALSQDHLQVWADSCQDANKKAFLRIPLVPDRPQKKHYFEWWLKRSLDWAVALLLLVLFSPGLIGLMLLMWNQSQTSIFHQQWCVGERGRIFKCYQFQAVVANDTFYEDLTSAQNFLVGDKHRLTRIGHWLKTSKMDRLPMLFNVLRGEMSLIGSHPITLENVVQLEPEQRYCFNAIPGIVSIYSLGEAASSSEPMPAYPTCLSYLRGWSLKWDLKLLLMTLSKNSQHW